MNSVHLLPNEFERRLEPHEIGQELTSVQRLQVSDKTALKTEQEELVVIIIDGSITFSSSEASGNATYRDMIYVPRNSQIEVGPSDGASATIVCFWAPCDRDTSFKVVAFSEVDSDPNRHHTYGDAANGSRREVWDFIDEPFDSQRMLCGQALGELGGWTAWPPHEHGEQREETYVYFGLDGSFGVQLVYEGGDGMDSPHSVSLVREGHLVSVPGGYHPSVGSPAGGLSYVYFMASRTKEDRKFMDLTIQPEYGVKFD
ncbi:5-deoxy-glucuronate isomerase [Demequina aurantiaca]|uniref:5-deoxy-glucuronate isomerase n=1 Tax=Demequina aurantiaca TaxID=676200 RepID=UPI003D32EE97